MVHNNIILPIEERKSNEYALVYTGHLRLFGRHVKRSGKSLIELIYGIPEHRSLGGF